MLLDTNAYTAFKMGDEDIIDIIRFAEVIALSTVVLGELLSGFDYGNKSKKNREDLQKFLQSSRVQILTVSSDTANFYSKIYCRLREKGRPIPTNDMWIAAQALEHGCYVCSYDKHFVEIGGLLIANKASDLSA